MKKRLLYYAQQRHQRRMTIFYLLNPPATPGLSSQQTSQLELEGMGLVADRPRTVREMFADIEYGDSDDALDE